jgi:hypothetical protein
VSEAIEETQVKCAACGREWVPSFAIDCYTIDGAELCEPCALPYMMKSPDPEPVDNARSQNVCKRGQGAVTCAFLGMHPGFVCLKHTPFEGMLRQRLAEGTMTAKGDNCSGPPLFKVSEIQSQ